MVKNFSKKVKNMNSPALIVMLTHNDCTVENAAAVFEACKASKAAYWGFKEKPLPPAQMKALFSRMKQCGKTTVLEVVEYTEKEGLEGAKISVDCQVDILMGTVYSEKIHRLCKENDIRYMPFVGKIKERPSILEGSLASMVEEAERCLEKGVDGFDLLAYRYTGNATQLIEYFVDKVPAPVCIAGSVDSFEKLDDLKRIHPWSFTIGGAFFENKFGAQMPAQIDAVCDYMQDNV